MYGKKHSLESRKKLSQSHQTFWDSKEGEKLKSIFSSRFEGDKNSFYGRKHSKAAIKKMSLAHIGNKSRLGMPHKETTKQKISESNQGHTPWNKGKNGYTVHSEESRQKISDATSGENNPNWQGGISFEPYGEDFNEELKLFIRKRDNFQCQICGFIEGETALDVHHIDYNKKNNKTQNLISLCHGCHTKTGYNRSFWIEYFKNI